MCPGQTEYRFDWYDIDEAPQDWDAQVQRLGQNVFHCADILAVHRYGNAIRRGVIVSEVDKLVGIVGGLVVHSDRGQRFESLSFPRHAEGLTSRVASQLVQWLKAQGFTAGKLGSFNGGVENWDIAEPAVQVHERLEFVWDLREGEKQWLEGLRTQHRRNLKKAMTLPMEFKEITKNRAWVLTRLRDAWERRKGVEAGWRGMLRSYVYHRRLERWLGRKGIGRLYGLYGEQGTPLSIAYMLEYGQTSFYMLGASSPEGYKTAASVRLFWELANTYHAASIAWLNLGGVPSDAASETHEEHGVYRFKAAFGIVPTTRQTLVF